MKLLNIVFFKCLYNINLYMNFIVDQMFAANKYFNDQEPWKKKEDTKEYIFITFALCALFCSNEEEDLY